MVVGDLGTYAGLTTDRHSRVLDGDRQLIPGLYAVGNDIASIMGDNYPGAGITLGPALTFGHIAGCHLAGASTGLGDDQFIGVIAQERINAGRRLAEFLMRDLSRQGLKMPAIRRRLFRRTEAAGPCLR